eukprot:scaffold39753_cov65-Phaeocystis_antarctica.AAC.12
MQLIDIKSVLIRARSVHVRLVLYAVRRLHVPFRLDLIPRRIVLPHARPAVAIEESPVVDHRIVIAVMRICHPRLAPSMIGPPRHGHPGVVLVDEHAPHVERLLVPREETSVRLSSEAKGPRLLRVRKCRATVGVRAVHVVRCRVKCASAEGGLVAPGHGIARLWIGQDYDDPRLLSQLV